MLIVDHIENWFLSNMLSTLNKVVIIIIIIIIIIMNFKHVIGGFENEINFFLNRPITNWIWTVSRACIFTYHIHFV